MKNFEEKIPETLKKVFDELTAKSIKFYDCYGYKTAEIEVAGVKIGIGINSNHSSIKIFGVKSRSNSDNDRKFYQSFSIGTLDGSRNSPYWNVELARGMLFERDFLLISQHFCAAGEIIKMIEIISEEIFIEQG